MASVWKRIQRVGKRASKFQFIASYQTLTLECSRDGKWQPNKLSVIWTRRSRRKATRPETWQPSIANPFRGMIVWTDPEEIEISVTLYKDARDGSPFEDKLWTFVIEDESVSGKRRPVASVSVNMVDYHSVDIHNFCLNLPLRPASKKVVSASLELNLACVLLKEGNAMDEDMISMSSLMSLNDPYGSRDFDNHGQYPAKNFKRNTGKRLSLRSVKSKNKPTFNLADNGGKQKESKKNQKNKGKTSKKDFGNVTVPTTNLTSNGLKKPISTSDTDLSKIANRLSPVLPKKEEFISSAEEGLLEWCQECVADYTNVTVSNMTTSWRNGMAFCAIIHHFNPDMIDFSKLGCEDIRENNRLAFEAFDYLGISRMLDPHQMVLASVPDKLLIMTYLHQIKQYFTTEAKPTLDDDNNDADDHCNDLTMAALSEAGKKFIQASGGIITDSETKNDLEKGLPNVVSQKESIGDLKKDFSSEKLVKFQYEPKPGYNPFDDEPMVDTSTNLDQTTVSSDSEKLRTKLSDNSAVESSSKDEVLVNEKNPSDFQTENQAQKRKAPEKPKIEDDKTMQDGFVDDAKVGNSMVEKQTEDTIKYSSKPEIVDDKKIGDSLTEKQTENTCTASNKMSSHPQREKHTENENTCTASNKCEVKQDALKEGNKMSSHPQREKQTENTCTASNKCEVKQDAHKEGNEMSSHPQSEKEADKNKIAPITLKINGNDTPQANTILHSPKPGYNPFLDDEKESLAVKSENHSSINEPLNPFDDDYEKTILQQSAQVEEIRRITAQVEKIRSLNPFDDDYDEIPEITKVDKSEVSAVVSNSTDRNRSSLDNSRTTVGRQSNNSRTTVEKQSDDSRKTVGRQSNNGQPTVEKQSDDSRTTVGRQSKNSRTTVEKQSDDTRTAVGRQSNNSQPTVEQQLDDSRTTVGRQSKNSRTTVEKQSDDSRTTVGRQSNNSRTTVEKQSNNSRTTVGRQSNNDGTESAASPVTSRKTGNAKVTNMHRKQIRRPASLASTITDAKTLQAARSSSASPTPVHSPRPTSPRKSIPSFEEWKAKKSDDVAKQERLKAQARQVIKDARAKNARSQSLPSNSMKASQPSGRHMSNQNPAIKRPQRNLSSATGLPKPTASTKKYRAPEPPGASQEPTLASKLKQEIEYQKKITEKTRKTLESSRIKRINPKQENVPEVEKRNERNDKVLQAIQDAKENQTRAAAKGVEDSGDILKPPAEANVKSETDIGVLSPPKPPRVYTYTDDTPTSGLEEESKETMEPAEPVGDDTEGVEESVEKMKSDDEEAKSNGASLQQNPFKLTFKKKEGQPQAVVKPISVATGKSAKIDLKKYSVNSRKMGENISSSVQRRPLEGQAVERIKADEDRNSGDLSSSQDSLSGGQPSSEEDVNDILDNIGNLSENEVKTDDELLYDDVEEEGFQDTSQYVEHEIATLEDDRIALDRVAVKLEKELRDAMNTEDCREEEQRLFQEWFLLVNKRNEIVRRQTELSILEKEEDLEKRFELLNRELRFLMADENREKSLQEKKREELLLSELVRLVNKRDELVRIEDSQVQQAEKEAKHVEHVVRNTKIPRKQADCSIQ